MKKQIVRFSLHQNAKVISVLTAACTLVIIVPTFLLSLVFAPASQRPPVIMFIVMPLIYLVASYLMVIVGCAVYNALYRYIGGIEFEAQEHDR